jgi:hypothetical protein
MNKNNENVRGNALEKIHGGAGHSKRRFYGMKCIS